jgi:hypothetical protein
MRYSPLLQLRFTDHRCRRTFIERLDNFGVSVSDSPDFNQDSVRWCQHGLPYPPNRGIYEPHYVEVRCAMTARYVFVTLPRNEYFALAEVEVFGASYAPTIDPSKRAEACARGCLALDRPDFKGGFSVKENSDSGACRESKVLDVIALSTAGYPAHRTSRQPYVTESLVDTRHARFCVSVCTGCEGSLSSCTRTNVDSWTRYWKTLRLDDWEGIEICDDSKRTKSPYPH